MSAAFIDGETTVSVTRKRGLFGRIRSSSALVTIGGASMAGDLGAIQDALIAALDAITDSIDTREDVTVHVGSLREPLP